MIRKLTATMVAGAALAAGLSVGASPASAIVFCGANHADGFVGGQYWVIGQGVSGCEYRYVVYYTTASGRATVQSAPAWVTPQFGIRTSEAVRVGTLMTVVEQYRPKGKPSQQGQRTWQLFKLF